MAVEPLKAEALYQRCEESQFAFETSAELEPSAEIVGQGRAVEALRFGLGMHRDGYNLFVMGPPHVGKFTIVRRFIADRAAEDETPADWCYVHNFEEPSRPRALRLPAGTGVALRRDMEQLTGDLQSAIPARFETDDYRARRQAIDEEFRERQEAAFEALRERARARDVALVRTPTGLAMAPVRGGDVIRPEVFQKLPEAERKTIQEALEELQKELEETVAQIPRWDKERRDKVRDLNREVVSFEVSHLIEALRKRYGELGDVVAYLNEVEHDIVESVESLTGRREEGVMMLPGVMAQPGAGPAAVLGRYRVNVLVDNSGLKGAPVVFEDHPTHPNLVGRIEHVPEMGALVTDFTLIKAGALHRACGGYLVLDARKLLIQGLSWEALKRALRGRELRIESLGQLMGLVSTVSLEPEPIPVQVKVVLVGDRLLYYMLAQYDPEFEDLFKAVVDFEDDFARDQGSTDAYARLVAAMARDGQLRPLDRGAMARVIERAARLADNAGKLTAQIDRIHDLLREADYWAGKAGRQVVAADDVQQAIDAQIERSDRVRRRGIEAITEGTILIDTEGARPGQVNGLSVITLGQTSFGRPSRITARVRLGRGEVVDIERKVALGGPLHSKGVYILEGFLGARFAGERPLSLEASLVFEQSYGGVDGDSASSTELYALLSALAEVPIKQSLAVTGSVNQHGEVQAIGGVNEKIEGFFDVCAARGLTGEQGVLIPASNVRHLMLRRDVVEAVEQGRFRIYPVTSVDEGITLLTGIPAGERGEDGSYPEGTVNYLAAARLARFAERRRAFGTPAGREEGEEGNDKAPGES